VRTAAREKEKEKRDREREREKGGGERRMMMTRSLREGRREDAGHTHTEQNATRGRARRDAAFLESGESDGHVQRVLCPRD